MLDVSVAAHRYGFIGREFLTWLWYQIDQSGRELKACRNEAFTMEIGNRLVMENQRGEGQLETVSIKGDEAGLEEAKLAASKGSLVSEMNLIVHFNDLVWRFTIKAESMAITGLRTPESAAVENEEDLEGAVLEKVYLYEQIIELLESAFAAFIVLRTGDEWQGRIRGEISRWIGSQIAAKR